MRIGIDIRLQNETGVGRYIQNLTYWFPKVDTKNEYVSLNYPIRWHSVKEQIEMPQLLRQEKLDLVHFPYFNVPLFYNNPFVVTIHDLIIDNYATGQASTLPIPLYWLKRLGYKAVMNHAVSQARAVIVPSHATKSELINHYSIEEKKVIVTHEGVDHVKKDPKIQRSKDPNELQQIKDKIVNNKFFLYVGNAYPHKNLEMLINAFANVAHQQREVLLVLVGKHDYFYKQLAKTIDPLPILHLIILTGEVSDETLDWLYAQALATVIPSLMEGFGFPALEAMNKKCLVIASKIPVLSEVCDNQILFFDPNKQESLEEQMKRVLTKPIETFETLISHAYHHVQQYKWIETAKQTVAVYERCISV